MLVTKGPPLLPTSCILMRGVGVPDILVPSCTVPACLAGWQLSAPLPAGSLAGVTVVLGAAGAACSTMCEQKGLACSQNHLHFLNSCDRLREVSNCEAGCVEEQHADTMPAAVDAEAPKASRPALCLVGTKPPESAFSCDAAANYMRRLCACIKAPDGGGNSSSTSSSSSAGSTSTVGSTSPGAGGAVIVSDEPPAVKKGPAPSGSPKEQEPTVDPTDYDDPIGEDESKKKKPDDAKGQEGPSSSKTEATTE